MLLRERSAEERRRNVERKWMERMREGRVDGRKKEEGMREVWKGGGRVQRYGRGRGMMREREGGEWGGTGSDAQYRAQLRTYRDICQPVMVQSHLYIHTESELTSIRPPYPLPTESHLQH